MGVSLSDDEVWAYLEAAHTGILTTLRADGVPIALPVWFVALDRLVFVGTPPRSKKVARIRHDRRASFLVEDGEHWADLRAVHLTGVVDVVDDEALERRVGDALDAKYERFRTPDSSLPAAARERYRSRTVLRFTPDARVLSWHNRKLRLGGPANSTER